MRPSSSNQFLRLAVPTTLVCFVSCFSQASAASVPATPATVVGDTITDPKTGASVKVTGLIKYKDAGLTAADGVDPEGVVYVVTDANKAILARTADDAVIFKINPTTGNPVLDAANKGTLYQVKARTSDATTGLVTDVTVYPKGGDVANTSSQSASFAVVLPPTDPPNPPQTPTLGSSGPINLVYRGAGGSNGNTGAIFIAAGDGGNGADGPTNTQDITSAYGNISATNVPGILAASIGGDGGKGGNSYLNLNGGGGDGGYAGSGGTVNLTNRVDLTVTGNNAAGIQAFSQSGRGGVGGDGILALGGGGAGGESRNGGTVILNNLGNISTNGERSHGISALSSGGTAGGGGNSFGLVGVGGSGSKAGNGGSVSVSNSGSITTRGAASHGILAQSVGGTGGDGGIGGGLVAFSGDGSTGGTGGSVSVNLNAGSNISTFGEQSSGVVAQSIGGGGGDSGASGGLVAFGAKGGAGNDGGTVTVTSAGGTAIATHANYSSGIVAQSIGGGGGSGGFTGGLVALNLGGSNSGGGAGKMVTVQNGGSISTIGEFSRGIFAQSIGGGGGAAGDSGGLVALGGKGGAGGASGKVTIGNGGTLTTDGVFSQGIFAQSIAGGGGSGGNAGGLVSIGGSSTTGGNSETVTVTNSGSITTKQGRSDAILAQSIGGGGGNAGSGAGVVAIGGSGASALGGNANAVTVSNLGAISTTGMDSRGIFAQAVGGGGGNGGAGTAGGIFAGFSLGGSGGAGGDGGKVSIDLDPSAALPALSLSSIQTTGDRSVGILAQSVGGGGGSGGDSITGTLGVYGSVSVAIGGDGAAGGTGGEVGLTGTGRVTTSGEMAHGVLLESVGGGGGNGGMSIAAALAVGDVGAAALSVALGGGAGAGGDGGKVTVTDADLILRTTGLQSAGFIAQSVGGGGGSGGMAISAAAAASAGASGALSVGLGGDGEAGGVGGSVNVTLGGSVTTTKAQSDGILIQSVGGGGGNGGMTVAGSLGVGAGAAGAIALGIGGSGSGGGNAGAVTADIRSDIDTDGDGSDGLIVQAVGGGGGNGGLSVAAGLAGAGVGAGSVTLGIGGSGQSGGTGNVVDATYAGTVITRGDHSTGILAQSVGGGGGNGGGAVSANLNGAGTGAGGVALGLGGKGLAGGDGGAAGIDLAVRLVTSGSVSTLGQGSSAIVAQSIGGGGGNGGFSVAAVGSGAGTGAGSVTVGLGGAGGGGGNGKRVEAVINSVVNTYSDDSGGVLAQSVGGGGGNGGFNVSASGAGAGTGSGAVAVGLGGNGGTAGHGGSVDATSTGEITTRGVNSSGFVAQSIGGGGGNGGFNVSGTISGAGTGSGAVSVGLGGGGAGGGNAGAVVARTSAEVVTLSNTSTGILAQSVGGGGGNGGFNVSASLSGAGTGSGAIGVGLGGNGGGGGNGSTVDLTVNNDVFTGSSVLPNEILGHDSSAVVAQSIGGGGGNGGFNVTVAGSAAGKGSGTVGVGIGGRGAGGGDGDRVTSTMTGDISTLGNNANGLLIQSVGGGGGNGGFNVAASISVAGTGSGAVGVGIGGSAGTGGKSGAVTSSLTGNVSTRGNNATGVTAQSLGGGGGNGAFNVTGSIAGAGTGAGGVSVGIGGAGGTGGDSDSVNNTVVGDVLTLGDNSGGVLAQSLGGGGGNGGFNISGTIAGAGTGAGAVSVGIGGSGGGGGVSKAVTNSVTGDVQTKGKNATAIVAQSIGGGGGNGGFNVSGTIAGAGKGAGGVAVGIGGSGGDGGTAGTVNNTVVGNITTALSGSGGVLAQSLGGGGGNGGMNISGSISLAGTGAGSVGVGIGGSGGKGGNAAKVTNSVTGDIFTSGREGFGIAAQSIGGGGGNGGFNVTAAIGLAKEGAGAIGIGVGGMGGDGGDAGDVDNTFSGYVQTLGDNATGVLAQSAGGGGGNGAFNISGTITAAKTGSGGLAIGVGGFGGKGGIGKDVLNNVTGGVVTTGNNSGGVLAQSFGGGGGNGGFNITGALNFSKENGGALGVGIGGFGGDGGNSGNVTSTVTTTLAHNQIGTTGDNSSAVVAQSIGGSGGNGALNITGVVNLTGKNGAAVGVGVGGFGGGAGNSGNVLLHTTGELVTQGNNSNGILAQSIGGGGGSGGTNITGTLAITTASGGSGKTLAASIGVGGFGGDGGNAGDVGVTHEGDITAIPRVWIPEFTDPLTGAIVPAHYEIKEGTGSHGLAAQSIGGGGGDGGVNVSAGISYASGQGDAYGLIVGIGGFGGGGGDAGNVNVDVTGGGTISSYGSAHSGIFAQSLGGGGGNGGINVSGGIVSDSPLIFGIGGFGADAGIAKNVTVTTITDIFTSASDANGDINPSAGLLAQSLGGGGGNGGLNVSGGIAIAKEASVPSVTIGIGGFGGAGAISGNVTVNHTGDVTSSGSWVNGILAQSIAGGGGNGGMNVSGQVNFADSENSGGKKDITIVAGVGGTGGTGADAGHVSVTHNGTVITSGDNALGVAAQSIGGGGGNGGLNLTGVFAKKSSPIAMGVGGSGSGGGHAGDVLVNRGSTLSPTGVIFTDGDGSTGLEASSIGGGGGNAGMNLVGGYSKAGADETASGFAANIAIGGSGGEAGNGGTAGVNNFSDIETGQKNSHGILAQSIGGGGGNGNYNMAMTYASANDKNLGFNLAVGGAPGDGGTGAQVDVLQKGNIITRGDRSFGILAQSIGGGGGNVGVDSASTKNDGGSVSITLGRVGGTGGFASDVNLDFSGSILTEGEGSFGMLAQSVGNGGGNSSATTLTAESASTDENPAKSIAVSIGLEGGSGGKAGNVTINADGTVITMSSGAHAIFAQSVGGGGGNGGDADTTGETAATVGLSLGGSGGTGGTGGIVHVTSSANVTTHGDASLGILAQSIGGGGGTGGVASAGGDSSKLDGITVAIGGKGGTGMAADKVTVANSGRILTSGLNAHGVLAQSLGGGGGNSGVTSNTIEDDEAEQATTRVAISVGGTGGTGAIAGDVAVTNTGSIGTEKENSIGIFAQSIGGGGGNADTVTTNTVTGKSGGNNISLGLGGSGGTGGEAGKVTVSNLPGAGTGQILTMGDHSHGILAMSVGGGGGNGSTTISTHKTGDETTDTSTNSYAFNLGGEGALGGTGGDVLVNNGGSIVTQGLKAHGIIAQSIGGGGGNGGMSVLGDAANGAKPGGSGDPTGTLRIGGKGGTGNVSGDVTVTNSGIIEVFGGSSYGIYAQSIGGGGGDGGFASSQSTNLLTNPKIDLAASNTQIAIGGNGGDGADSGNVLVTHTGTITSHGDNSYGIFAQSLGGGGGNVGHSQTSPAWMAADYVISALIGGRDGSKGTAGTVTLNTTGDIAMLGKNSTAQFAQSVNGGGGNADLFLDVSQHAIATGADGVVLPDNGRAQDEVSALLTSAIELGTEFSENGAASAIESTHVGSLFTTGKDSAASLLQSIGGGGGNAISEIVVDSTANVTLGLVLGGKNSTDNGGGDVTINRNGNVATTGSNAQGLGVQSIGGGGGNVTANVRRKTSRPASSTPAALAAPVAGVSGTAQLGAVAGTASDGGNITLDYKGDLGTTGNRATGLVVQSIGGGGGNVRLGGLDSSGVTLGGTDGTTGNGGDISLSNVGGIVTRGNFADGVILQSIGGGGGIARTDLRADDIVLALNKDNSGDGGAIRFDQNGNIVVTGKGSIAVLAQTLGGGGGIVDRLFADTAGGAGTSGSISLRLDGNVLAEGTDGIAVFAQSRGANGQGNIDIELTADKMIHAGKNGEGVHFSGGTNNRFNNHGAVATADLLKGKSAIGEDGNDAIHNFGTFYGQFALGGGTNTFVNETKGTFVPGKTLDLGNAANLLVNEGDMMPGDMDLAQHTDLTGSFTQTGTGVTHAELDFAGDDLIDNLSMTGTATLAGTVAVSLLNPQLIRAGNFQETLFHGDAGVTDAGMTLSSRPSVVVNYNLTYPTGKDAVLDYTVDFSPTGGGGMGKNLREVGSYFNRIQNAGSSPELADTVVKLLYTADMTSYRFLLSQLSPDFYGEQQAEQYRSAQRFSETLADGGQFRFMDHDKLVWFNFATDSTTHDGFDDYKKATQTSDSASFGVQKQLKNQWILGGGLGMENNQSAGYDGRWSAKGDTFHLGGTAKRDFGGTEILGAISWGWNDMDYQRSGGVTDPFKAKASRNLDTFTAMARISHAYEMGASYIVPAIDLGLTRLQADGASESGGGPTALQLGDYSEVRSWIHPAVNVGNIHTFGSGLKLHVYAELGFQYFLSDDHTDVEAGFAGAPAGVNPMNVPIDLGSNIEGSVGVQLINSKNASLGLEYGKIIDRNYDIDHWGVRLNVPF